VPTKYFSEEFTINADLASVVNAIQSILVDTKFFNEHETRIIYGLPRYGAMNPVVVTVKITAEAEKSHISLCGAAKEGLIKQNTSQRAVEEIKRILEGLAKTH
jgi:gamma-glutamyl phosphate reductase